MFDGLHEWLYSTHVDGECGSLWGIEATVVLNALGARIADIHSFGQRFRLHLVGAYIAAAQAADRFVGVVSVFMFIGRSYPADDSAFLISCCRDAVS